MCGVWWDAQLQWSLTRRAMNELCFGACVPRENRVAIADIDTSIALRDRDTYGLILSLQDADV